MSKTLSDQQSTWFMNVLKCLSDQKYLNYISESFNSLGASTCMPQAHMSALIALRCVYAFEMLCCL